MKHLLIWASKEVNKNFNECPENPRVINCLWDVGTRHRQTGKSTAIAELAFEKALENPLKEVIIIVPAYRNTEHMMKKVCDVTSRTMIGIFHKPQVIVKPLNDVKEYIKYCNKYTKKQLIVLADDCNLNKLLPEWDSECIVEKFGWYVPEFNKE